MKRAFLFLAVLAFLWPIPTASADDTVAVRGFGYARGFYDGFSNSGSFSFDRRFFPRPTVEIDVFGRRRIFRRAAVRIIISPQFGGFNTFPSWGGGWGGGGFTTLPGTFGGGYSSFNGSFSSNFSSGGFGGGFGGCPSGG